MTIEEYYDKRSSCYDSTFDMLYFKVFDVITWKNIEPYVPVDPDARALQFELVLCEKPDALALAGHMQAIAYKP